MTDKAKTDTTTSCSTGDSCNTDNSKCCLLKTPLLWTGETWALLVLRIFLGIRFVLTGSGKFMGQDGFALSNYHNGTAAYISSAYADKLPDFMLLPYAHTIAYVQLFLGLAVLLGVKLKLALAFTALTYVSLAFGKMLLPPSESGQDIANLAIHIILAVLALMLVKHSKLELLK